MKSAKIIGNGLTNIPWQERDKKSDALVWRYKNNPIIPRDIISCSDSVFNSAVVPYKGAFAGVFRVDHKTRNMNLHKGFSDDGIDFEISEKPLEWNAPIDEIKPRVQSYDPRVVKIDDKYYIMWCNTYHGYTIGLGYTEDFETFHQLENAFLPFNRNGVLFPRKINGKYAMLSRPSDAGHTPFGDIFLSQSPDLKYWGEHRWVMGAKPGKVSWEDTKIGAGPAPIETTEGWLIFYHGVLCSCNGFVYSMGAALLDLDEPWKIIARGKPYLLSPKTRYECIGNTPNVVFPCAALTDADTGRIAVYYGGADTVVGLAFCKVDEVIDFIKKNNQV